MALVGQSRIPTKLTMAGAELVLFQVPGGGEVYRVDGNT